MPLKRVTWDAWVWLSSEQVLLLSSPAPLKCTSGNPKFILTWPSDHVWQIRLQPRASAINLHEAQVPTWLLRHPLVVPRPLQSAAMPSWFNLSEFCWVQRASRSLPLKSLCSCPPQLNQVFIGRMNKEWFGFWVPSGCPLLSWSQLCLVQKFLCNPPSILGQPKCHSSDHGLAQMSSDHYKVSLAAKYSALLRLFCAFFFHEKHTWAQMLHENQIWFRAQLSRLCWKARDYTLLPTHSFTRSLTFSLTHSLGVTQTSVDWFFPPTFSLSLSLLSLCTISWKTARQTDQRLFPIVSESGVLDHEAEGEMLKHRQK